MSDYLSVLVTLIIGLALTDLAASAHRLLRARKRVRWHWMTPMVGLIFLLQLMGFWWIWYGAYAGYKALSVAQFLPDLAILLLLYLTASAALPDEVPADPFDLRAYYYETTPHLWTLFAIYCAIPSPTIDRAFFAAARTPLQILLYELPNIALVALGLTLSRAKRPAVHAVLLIALFLWTLLIQLTATIAVPR